MHSLRQQIIVTQMSLVLIVMQADERPRRSDVICIKEYVHDCFNENATIRGYAKKNYILVA